MQQHPADDPRDGTASAAVHQGAQVLFVHGLLLRGYESAWLKCRLHREGLHLVRFRYASRREPPAQVAARLAAMLRGTPYAHVVAHSLGGLIALAAIAAALPVWQGRAVLLGSPLAGSACARRVCGWWGGSWILGSAREWLCRGMPAGALPPGRIARIAGTRNRGIGRAIGACADPGDGVVALAETGFKGVIRLPDVDTTHLGLLFNPMVADAVVDFLQSAQAR